MDGYSGFLCKYFWIRVKNSRIDLVWKGMRGGILEVEVEEVEDDKGILEGTDSCSPANGRRVLHFGA